ncbi:LOW QUALITY PROTEIN: uncharacterized protein LOC112602403 [Melanaphis sacchari]|uniref:LOW QUALITY PROTEIN: uncharacterized protein LOC112602403 n=1 Tax=Melanaphis sacchari TaxID=742174 RepID=UPI000DC14F5C|nr:LOW QUALITY PROTEIN: uncharacterized protein LOC112602403 [Melanaphis sacchari]
MSTIQETQPDIQFLKTHNLMNDHMIANILEQRKLFIQQTATGEITQDKCLNYIKLELNVMDVCKLQINVSLRKKNRTDTNVKILTWISNQIDYLYYSTFQLFSIEPELLIEYMEFQKKLSFITNEIHPLVVLMSKKNCDPKLYLSAAMFEYENHNIEMTRKFFDEGIKKHYNNKHLRLEQFRIEILYLEETCNDSCQIIIQKYKETIEHFRGDYKFHVTLLEKSLQFKSIKKIQYIVIRDFIEIYQQNDLMWHKVALLCADGFIYDHDTNSFNYTNKCEDRIRFCIKSYQQGLKILLDMERKRTLIEFFIKYLIKQWISNAIKDRVIRTLVNKAMERAFHMSHYYLGGLQKPEYYVYWAEHTNEIRPNILKLAIKRNKDNVNVWTQVLNYYIDIFDNYKLAKRIFDDGVQALGNKSLPLWKIMDLFLQNISIKLLEAFYENGAESTYREINVVYKVEFLQWRNLFDDIDTTRKLFYRFTNTASESKMLYLAMIDCEKSNKSINVEYVRNLYTLACSKFGYQDNDDDCLWADSIKFEFMYGKSSDAEKIYNVASRLVKPELKCTLKIKYDSMKEKYKIE